MTQVKARFQIHKNGNYVTCWLHFHNDWSVSALLFASFVDGYRIGTGGFSCSLEELTTYGRVEEVFKIPEDLEKLSKHLQHFKESAKKMS